MTHRLTAVTVDACVRAELAQVFTGHDEEGEEVDRGSGGSAGPSGHARASGTKRSQQAGVGALNDGADDSHASEDQDEDEDESDEDFDPDAKRARGGGEGGAAGKAVWGLSPREPRACSPGVTCRTL